ncbi:BRCA1-associated ATM activator 1-like [Saccostrea echinata]|uniref:BRCA1-associated ATM activator 1-like n=1 Tax=Saccostrea echinata TaxID=191078 RepID=UPI002A835595|nr:BRCA1-associated ATM activator 1-like [Saccostrea echinata]XP_061175337.1 BRCA1-associated ATM activator 1-like [Saccostrea echinata]
MAETEYCKKLQQALEFLQTTKCQIHDDTLYQKLLDDLSEKVISAEFAEKCGVISFIQATGKTPDVRPDTLVFAVQLIGRLVSKIKFSLVHLNIISSLIETILSNKWMENLSVSCALLKTLTIILRSAKDICANINLKEIFMKSFDVLREERSIFLSRAASDFINSVFTSDMAESEEAKCLLKELQATIVDLKTKDCQRVLSPSVMCSLRVLERVPCYFSECFDEIFDPLIWLMKNGNTQAVTTATRCICRLSESRSEMEVVRVKSQISPLLNMLDSVRCLHIAKILYPVNLIEKRDLEDLIVRPLQLDNLKQPSSPSPCLSAICQSLTVINECNIHNPEICNQVYKVLRMTADGQEEIIDTFFSQNLISWKTKIQIRCLEYLESYVCEELIPFAFSVISNITASSTDHTIYRKCLDCLCILLPWILSSSRHSSDTSTVTSDLCKIRDSVQKNFCSMDWEFRDTSCEFVKKLLEKNKESQVMMSWILDSRFLVFAYQAVSDGESYVRATGLSTLQTVLTSTHVTSLLQDIGSSIDEVISGVLDICNTDSEAFPRRSAVTLLSHCWGTLLEQLQPDTIQNITQSFSLSLPSDFDWEVKLKVVDFWCIILKNVFAADITTSSRTVVFSGCLKCGRGKKRDPSSVATAVDVLLKLSCDYDPSVSKKTHQELHWISEHLERLIVLENPLTNGHGDTGSFWCSCCSSLVQEIYDKIKESKEKYDMESKFITEYDYNSLSLLDDILSLDKGQEEEDEENVIDCY